MGIKHDYILKLKENSGMSWGDLEKETGFPLSTIRDHMSGRVAKPNMQIIAAVVTAMGGSMSEAVGNTPGTKEESAQIRRAETEGSEEMRLTVETMRRIRNEMLDAQQISYERQIAHIKESYTREISGLQSSNKALRTTLYLTVVTLLVILVAIIAILIYDITHLDRGWVQAFYSGESSRAIWNPYLGSFLKWFGIM